MPEQKKAVHHAIRLTKGNLMPLNWPATVKSLLEGFTDAPDVAEYPSIAFALDDGIDDRLKESLAEPSPINPRYVEDLLADCVNRIANCLVLKEKANEVEVRAIGDAMSYKVQVVSLRMNDRIQELLAPLQERLGANALGTKTSAGSTENIGDKELWEKIREAQKSLSKIQAEVVEALKNKAQTPGNGANYSERFRLLKELFELGIVETYRRCVVCARGLKMIYGLERPVPKVSSSGYLNELALWAQKASDALDLEIDGRMSSEVALAIGAIDDAPKEMELLTRTAFNAAIAAGNISFMIKPTQFDSLRMKSVVLRSMRFQIKSKTEDAKTRVLSLQVKLPGSALTSGDSLFNCTSSTQYQDSEGNETGYGVHNLSPIGDWSIKLPERFVTGEPLAELVNIYLFLKLSYRR